MDWEAFYNHFREPDFVSGYEIQNRLGGGAFGEVYKARKHSIGKAYAVKFLKLDDESQREAVERELEQVRHFAAIDHPNLVTIEDMGTVMNVPYLIMGYAGEDTLSRRLREGKLDQKSALMYFVQTCRGVLALHDRRLVHFDLKPSNVFIKGDIARVGDYGLSRLMLEGRMTLSFGRGTPQYMAPEMIKGRADHRADVYSLGVILFESVAGVVPFDAESPGALVLRSEDRPPAFPEDFPARVRPVVERCLRLAPEDRYATVDELLEDLGQTARPGDSVLLDWVPGDDLVPSTAAGGAAPKPETPSGEGKRRGTRDIKEGAAQMARGVDDIAQTAAELARGAAGVARGVWEGLRTASQRGEDESQEPAVLTEAAKAKQAPKASKKAATPFVLYTLSDEPLDETPPVEPAVAGKGAGGTIPVPPRVAGGPLGAVWASLVLALEVLVSLITNLARGVFKGFGRAGDNLMRSTGSILGRTLRFTLFLVLLAVLGAGVTLIAAFFLTGGGIWH